MENFLTPVDPATPLTVYGRTIQFGELHANAVIWQITKGMKHTLGNVTDSNIQTKKIEPELEKLYGEKEWAAASKDTRRAAIAKFRADNTNLVESWKNEERERQFSIFRSGDVPKERGEGVDSVAKLAERYATESVVETLKSKGLAEPKKGETISLSGVKKTMEEMVAKRLGLDGTKPEYNFRERAEAEVARRAKEKADRLAENAGKAREIDEDAEDLDL